MSKIYDFKDSINDGKQGENIILAYLLKEFPDMKDVSDDPDYQEKGYDFIGGGLTWELKTEPFADFSGNFFFEYVSNDRAKTPGCFVKSTADKWMHFLPERGMLYIFDLEPLREFVNRGRKHREDKPVKNVSRNGGYHFALGQTRNIELTVERMEAVNAVRVVNIRDFFDYDYDSTTHVISNIREKVAESV